MSLFLTVVHVIVCLFLVVVVLLQRGKGADIGAVFGSGSGTTLFGSRGAGNFLTRLTTGAAVVFMLTSLSLAYFAQEGARSTLLDDDAPAASEPTSPFAEPEAAAPAPAAEGAASGAGGFEQVPAPDAPATESAPAPAPDATTAAPAPAAPAPPPAKAPATP